MKHRSFFPGVWIAILLWGCIFLPLALSAQQLQSITVGEREREYYLHLPTDYSNNTAALPLVIGLHGANQQAYEGLNSFANMTGLDAKADTEQFVVVYPVGIGSDILQVPTWNAGKCCLPASTSRMPDAAFISALIDELISKYRIDRRRVYTMGFSNGGMMSLRLACELSDKIAAVVSHSGPYMYDGTCTPKRPVPLLYVHGQQDSVVPYYGGVGRLSTSFSFTSADSTLKIWRGVIGCNEQPEVILEKPNASGTRWASCNGGSQLQHYTASDGIHWWIGAPVGMTSKAFVTTDIAWNFVRTYSLPPTTTDVIEPLSEGYTAQISPNPAADKVNIHLQLPAQQYVILSLQDILGRRVEDIYTGTLRDGSYDFSINTAAYGSGTLFARVQYGNTMQVYPLYIIR